jgi:hypothetical protein
MSSSIKQIAAYVSLIALSIIVFITSILNQSAHQANKGLGLASPRPTMRQNLSIDIVVPLHGNFTLQNPGVLPSHPLYALKMVNDRLVLLFTTNPEKHARLLYSYSNTRMSAANELIKRGEADLAVTTAVKGQAYMWQALNNSQHIPDSFQPEWYDSIKHALLKHEEIIEKIRFVTTGAQRDQADRLWHQLEEYRQYVGNLSGVPFNLPRPEDAPAAIPAALDEPYL